MKPTVLSSPTRELRAVRVLGSNSLRQARGRAAQVLARAGHCPCCKNLLAHVFDRLGSTLFLDDDPSVLARAFEPAERDTFSALVLAACVVLEGRPRIAPALA